MTVTNALVLNYTNYRDNDRMVTLLSPTLGRIDAIARGCRKVKSPLMNATERFCAGEFTLVENKGRYTLTLCQINESFFPLREDVDRLTAGAYFLHLLIQAALPGQPCEEMFMLALKALAYLAYGDLPVPMVVMGFELHYLDLLGQAPRVDSCLNCGKPFDTQDGVFLPGMGGALCKKCGVGGQPMSHGARRILLRTPVTRFEALEKMPGHPNWPEAARHVRRFLKHQLNQQLDQRPKLLWPALPEEEGPYPQSIP